MVRIAYPAIITHPDDDTGLFGVVFPDLPGCTSTGNSIDHAFLNAGEALELHLDGIAQDGDKRPTPSTLDAARTLFLTDYQAPPSAIAAVLLVSATLPGRTQRFNITMDVNLVSQIDALTDNRSAFLAAATRAELARRRHAP